MKEAANHLEINYSTAKTIVQTFRKENRVTKNPKRQTTTKRSIEKERFLLQFLSQLKVKKLMASIVKAELEVKKELPDIQKAASEARTLGSFSKPNPLSNSHKSLPRVESAGEMLLFELEEEGPYPGQISRGILVNMDMIVHKRPIFFVLADTNLEEEYKQQLDYSNPVLLRNRQPIKNKELISTQIPEQVAKSMVSFNFHEYGKRILANAENKGFEYKSEDRRLPMPKIMNHFEI